MIVGVPTETYPGENRVALIPAQIAKLKDSVWEEVLVQAGAGTRAGFPDSEYEAKGATLVSDRLDLLRRSDLLLQVRGLGANPQEGRGDLEHGKEAQIVIGFQEPLTAFDELREYARRGVSALAMETIPRITRAQSMDALSSMATISGYKGVLIAADHLPRMFPMMMTAAGTITPARVFIIGAGVAGLQAIASARKLGAVVTAYDVRSVVKEQIESLGAKFLEIKVEAGESEDKGGYAKELSEDFYRRQREEMTKVLSESDVVMTTAAVPGKKAPILVTTEMVQAMPPGSVVVDLAAERGGNCEATTPGEKTMVGEVTVLGPVNLPSTVPYHASQMYSKNISTLLAHLVGEDGFNIDPEDEITAGTLITHKGEIVHPMVKEIMEKTA